MQDQMPDYYEIPALILTALLLPAFAYLYVRFRDTRTLLWFLGFVFACIRMILLYKLGAWYLSAVAHPWMAAAGQTSILISSALFLGSLAPKSFSIGRFRILYVIPFIVPLVVVSLLLHGVFHGVAPQGPMFLIFPGIAILSLITVLFWSVATDELPTWFGTGFCALGGIAALWTCFAIGPAMALLLIECLNHFMTVLLILFVFRRFSPGILLSVMGFLLWSAPILLALEPISSRPAVELAFTRAIILGKVIAALGMILLALEDEVEINQAAQERERRARLELQAYTSLILSRRRLEDFDRQGAEICRTVVDHSLFSQAALLLENAGTYRLAGSAGIEPATAAGLGELAARIPVLGFLAPGSAPIVVEDSQALSLDLTPWLRPGDDLARLRFTSAIAVPLTGRSAVEGVLLLAGKRSSQGNRRNESENWLRADDLLPIEMLAARLQATRSQTMMLEKLIDSEKFAGLGQLASNVTQQLNNPLTVILGYASLLEEAPNLDPQERKGIESILTEARRMRSTLESLSRVSRAQGDQRAAVSVAELLADMEQLHRSEFLNRSIEFRLSVAPALPRVLCSEQQLRQAVLHCLQFAIEAVENRGSASAPSVPKTIRLEATSEGSLVQILVGHSGPGFSNPERAFDPFTPAKPIGETAGLGLSLCATILRDHNGRASAVNFEPTGAAIILELRAA